MKTYVVRALTLVFALCAWSFTAAAAGEFGTKEEAQAMVEKAAAFLQANGKDKAVAAFSDPKGAFADRDLYVILAKADDGERIAHINPRMIGKSFVGYRDVDGKAYGDEVMELVRGPGKGWVDYKFTNPVTKEVGDKSSYVLKAGDLFLVCGAYKN
jgi:cytochrome c